MNRRAWRFWAAGGAAAFFAGAILAPPVPAVRASPVPSELPGLTPLPMPSSWTDDDSRALLHTAAWGRAGKRNQTEEDEGTEQAVLPWRLVGIYRRGKVPVAVFARPGDPDEPYVKAAVGETGPEGERVIAIEQDRVSVKRDGGNEKWIYVQRQAAE